ncbi:hypothetical protein DL96DRAFT_1630865 [Flagelloscypha sp. PMI_526]|nr:hypothetical protein DL96DRAFT_1630865 [Flagelloscypha sp. PMI_526]
MSSTRLPTELLEQIVSHISNDSNALSMCCRSSRVLVSACRFTRFKSITLANVASSAKFHALLENSPRSAVAMHVKSLTIINPQDYHKNAQRHSLVEVLNHVRIFLEWLQDTISELPSLRSFGTEDWDTRISVISSWPYYCDVTALGIFAFECSQTTPRNLERLRLAAFRVSDIGSSSVQAYLDSPLLKWLDLSHLRSLAFCTDIEDTPSTTGNWLSAFLQVCSSTLEYLVLEPQDVPDDFEFHAGGFPCLTRVTITVTSVNINNWDDVLLPWVDVLLGQCQLLQSGEITFLLMESQYGPPTTGSLDPGRLLAWLEEVKEKFPACSFVVAHRYKTLVLKAGLFPPSIALEPQCTYVKFWTRFYST